VNDMVRPVPNASPTVETTAEDSIGTSARSATTWTWLRSMLKDDFGSLQPRLLLASLLVSPLPRHSLNRWRTVLYRTAGLRLGAGTVVFDRIKLSGPGDVLSRFKVGRGCIINGPFFADLNAEVIIGDGVSIGHHAIFITADHAVGPASFRAGKVSPAPIHVGDGVLIGARVTVLPGVTIGHGSVIAAGSLVAGDIAPNKLVGGNPARVIKALPEVP
jgi:maltose O-acetyltransferase